MANERTIEAVSASLLARVAEKGKSFDLSSPSVTEMQLARARLSQRLPAEETVAPACANASF